MTEKQNNGVNVGGRDVKVRGLTRAEIKQLAEEGINPGALPASLADTALERVLEMVLDPEDNEYLAPLVYAESVKVYKKIMDLTYGKETEAKN